MVSIYPKKGELYSAGTSGVASYAKNVVSHMNRKIVVLADYQGKPEIYEEKNVLVVRCFQINTPVMWIKIFREILRFGSIKNILIQLDFAVYGSVITTSCVLPFLALLKLMGYQTFVTMHHLVLNIFKLKGHVGLGDGLVDNIKGFIFNTIFHLFYRLLSLVTDRIIVLEEVLKKKLTGIIPPEKIITIPHGVDVDLIMVSKDEARKTLGISQDEYMVLFFGFINWFKGADFFVDAFKHVDKILGKRARFIIAGGKSPTMQDKPFYQEYFDKIVRKVDWSKKIEITGYVSQEKIANYFSACDLVVFPYRHFMTASGVLSLVFSYKKPFIVSEELGKMFDTDDLQKELKIVGLAKDNFVFNLNKTACLSVTKKVLADGLKPKMISLAGIIREKRQYKNIAILYEKLFAPSISLQELLSFKYTGSYEQ